MHIRSVDMSTLGAITLLGTSLALSLLLEKLSLVIEFSLIQLVIQPPIFSKKQCKVMSQW